MLFGVRSTLPRLSAFILLIFFAVSAYAFPIYKYVDEDGTVAYTDQEQLIPEKYRPNVMVLNQESVAPAGAGAPPARTAVLSPRHAQPRARFGLETIGPPLVRGIAGIVVLVAGVLLVRRVAGRDMLSAGFVKTAMLVIVIGCLGELYLAQRFAMEDGESAGWHIRRAVARNVSRVKSEVKQAIEQPLKPVRQSVQKANAAMMREQDALRQIGVEAPPVPPDSPQ